MTIKITAEEYQEKQARRLKGSLDDIRSGIAKVTESPTAKAALKKDKMLANLTESVNSGRWASRLNAVTVEQWKDKALTKGVDRIPAGIDGAKDKVIAFAQQLLPYEGTLQVQVNAMPDTTLEDSISRATAWMRGMSKFHRK
jgi:hypothetical protein